MSQFDRQGLISQSNFLFPDNTAQEITPSDIRQFDLDIIDSFALTGSLVVSASYAISSSHSDNSDNSISASYAVSASQAENADNAISASHAIIADNSLEIFVLAKNTSGHDIPKGYAVHSSGVTGDKININTASYDDPTLMPAIGITQEAISNNAVGEVILTGRIQGINTSNLTPGATVYVNGDGSLTSTKPTGSALIQNIGTCVKSNATEGEILVLGSGRSNDVPNIQEGYAWVGNSNGLATAVSTASWDAHTDITQLNQFTASADIRLDNIELTTASLQTEVDGLSSLTGSYATTGSNTFTAGQTISAGNLEFGGTGQIINNANGIVEANEVATSTLLVDTIEVNTGTAVTLNTNTIISGSTLTEVNTQGITSLTASIDFSDTSLFELTLGSGVDTHIDASNIGRGQTINVLITQDASVAGTVSFSPKFLQPSGSEYTATTTLSGQDILTFITYNDTSKVYVVATNKFE